MKSPFSLRTSQLLALAATLCLPVAMQCADDTSPTLPAAQPSTATIIIPGPLRSFMRMAAISQKVPREEIVSLFARNVFAHGYEGPPNHPRQTEFLVLLKRYVQQARELSPLAGADGVLRVSNCQEAQPVLQILGYKAREDCGQKNTYLETSDAEKAFVTTDSGFPLPALERALQGGRPFEYPFASTPVPVIFTESDWVKAEDSKNTQNLVDAFVGDPMLARLYWAMHRIDSETQTALLQSPGLRNLLPMSAVLDFYGGHICIRNGRLVVPGGDSAEADWKELAGASPSDAGEFVDRMLSKDRGWLAVYFDALSRVNPAQQAHFVQPHRLKRYYQALAESSAPPDPARPAFRPNPGLLLLVSRLQWDANGEPHVPGNLDAWKSVFRKKSASKTVRSWSGRAGHWHNNEQLVEAMFGLTRAQTENGPLQLFLFLTELDAKRPAEHKVSPETVALLGRSFTDLNHQYLIFSEFPALDDKSIASFIDAAENLTDISNHTVRGNALGTFQALIGMWQILARQGQIPESALNDSWQRVIKPLAKPDSSTEVFDAGRNSLRELLLIATGKARRSQDEIIEILAGPAQKSVDGQRIHQELAGRIRSIMDSQRLVSLDTLLALGDGLNGGSQTQTETDNLVRLAGQLREFEMPQPIFTNSERHQWATGVYNNKHTELQMRTDLTKVVKSPASAQQLAEARGQLAPFFRDTLVGLNYAYYEPPGAQILRSNPLFVRSHDFSGDTVAGMNDIWQAPRLFGKGFPAGGGAHFVGSLAELPYVLSEAEQNFITPENVQALIWEQVVPGLLTSAIVPRWWDVTPNELHAVALYQKTGEELAISAIENADLRGKVISILSERMSPRRTALLDKALRAGELTEILPRLAPADTFYLAIAFQQRFADHKNLLGPSGTELNALAQRYPAEINWAKLSRDFGVPHPVLTQNYGRELLNFEPFPAFSGYSSRLLAECWDSNNLYWARLADEMGYPPVMLHRIVPQLTHRMVEKIFATDLEDWSALLRAAHETGDEFRQGKIAFSGASGDISRR